MPKKEHAKKRTTAKTRWQLAWKIEQGIQIQVYYKYFNYDTYKILV